MSLLAQTKTHAHPRASDRRPHEIRIFELDPKAALVAGHNPLQIDRIQIPFIERLPRRTRDAKAAVESHVRRTASVSVAPDGSLVAIVQAAAPAQQPNPNQQALVATRAGESPPIELERAVAHALSNPQVMKVIVDSLNTRAQGGGA